MSNHRHVSYTKEEREARVKWIVELYGTCSFKDIQRKTGSGVMFIKKVLREQGIDPVAMPFKKVYRKAEERKKTILELVRKGVFYKEIAQRLNITMAYVSMVARDNGIRMTKEEVARRSGIGFHNLMESEKKRVRFGLEQRTKRKISINPNRRKIYEVRTRMRKRGYIVGENLLEVYFDVNTRRDIRCENTARKYSIKVNEYQGTLYERGTSQAC